MAHGYLRDFDEEQRRSEARDRDWRENSNRDDRWRTEQRGNERNRDFMLGDRDRSWERDSHRNNDRDFFDRMGDRARSAFDRDDRQGGGWRQDQSGWSGGEHGGSSDWERTPRNFSSHQDDHYRSWRDRQMSNLDRDYADYCREREQQFHSDFDNWRSQRRDNVQPLRTGMTQTGTATDPEGMPDITTDLETSSQSQPGMADATLGTAPNKNRR